MVRKAKADPVTEAIDRAVPEQDGIIPISPDCGQIDEDAGPVDPIDPSDPRWQEFVMSKFDRSSDFDHEGNPYAESCRRVAASVLGPIIAERIRTVQVPSPTNGYRSTMEVSVEIAWHGDMSDIRVFEDIADVYPGNTDIAFARFAPASAKTKALGRAYRAALMLRKVYTSEELTRVPVADAGLDGRIVSSQRKFIDRMCREMDINVAKFINCGKLTYRNIGDVDYEKAGAMIETLNGFQQDRLSIPGGVVGYDPNWSK